MVGLPIHDEFEAHRTILTPREREVLSYLTAGCTNQEIGDRLFISGKTVNTYVNSIFRKLRVASRLQAILNAIHHGKR